MRTISLRSLTYQCLATFPLAPFCVGSNNRRVRFNIQREPHLPPSEEGAKRIQIEWNNVSLVVVVRIYFSSSSKPARSLAHSFTHSLTSFISSNSCLAFPLSPTLAQLLMTKLYSTLSGLRSLGRLPILSLPNVEVDLVISPKGEFFF